MHRYLFRIIPCSVVFCMGPLHPAECADGSTPPEAATQARKSAVRFSGYYWGTVTALTPDSITIQGQGDAPQGGKRVPINGVQTFGLSDTLRSGGFLNALNLRRYSYRLADVAVGDRVLIRYDRVGGDDYCWGICIERRPGGRVPPAQRDLPGGRPWHEVMNAQQDFEEKGIPLPSRGVVPKAVPEAAGVTRPDKHPAVPRIPPAKP